MLMHMLKRAGRALSLLLLVVMACSLSLRARAQVPNPYGLPITVDVARRAAVAAIVEAKKNGWTVAAAVVDPTGALVYFERIDATQSASSDIAQSKGRTAAAFKRPTKFFEDAVAAGRPGFLSVPGALALEGGIPIIIDGKIVGAIGVSGSTSQQDGVCAQAGVNSVSPPVKSGGPK